ncbi:MAG: DUF2974 domain-containing protein [Clostridia bacterium]|nr:DUF2974 domain-containing protein [Clostridia bacterium]
MANMVDYLAWRGDLHLETSPWNEIDGLLIATISYLDFNGGQDPNGWMLEEMARIDLIRPGTSSAFPGRKTAFEKMAACERFHSSRLHHAIALTDPEIGMQFSAMCLDLPDGTTCVAFRGTDNTVVGWREDFDMAYTTRVPAQEAAALYLTRAAALSKRPLRLVGHSKGGNLAVYAAAFAPAKVQKRIESIWSYDGPGMNRETSQTEGYLRIREKIRSFIPQTSIIGLLMDYYDPYTVVRSTASGISQHDPMSWQVYGPQFRTMKAVDKTAVVVRDTLHEWLQNSTPEQRAAFVDTLFSMVESTKATRISDLSSEKLKSILTMVGSRKEVDPETRKVFTRLVGQAVSLGFGNVIDWVRGRRDEGGTGDWETMSPEKRREMLNAAMNSSAEGEAAETADSTKEQKEG